MSLIRLQPTVSLTEYAERNKNDLCFGPEESPPQREVFLETRKLNWFSKCVRKLDDVQSKIGTCCRTIFILTLTLSIVGIPFRILWMRESALNAKDRKTEAVALETLNMKNNQWNKRAEIKENLGIENFENIPSLDLQGRMGDTDYIDFLRPEDLSSPIMKGIDKFERPFISIKIKDKTNEDVFVITLFQRYTNYERWTWGTNAPNGDFASCIGENVLTPNSEQVFKQIFQDNHPRFTLAA